MMFFEFFEMCAELDALRAIEDEHSYQESINGACFTLPSGISDRIAKLESDIASAPFRRPR